MANEYGIVQNGNIEGSKEIFQNIVKENGGSNKIDEALKIYDKPLIKIGVNKLLSTLGIENPENIINGAAKEVKGLVGNKTNVNVPINEPKTINRTSQQLANRLAKLK